MRRDLKASEISHPNRVRNDNDFFVISTNGMRRDLKVSEISHPNRVRNDRVCLSSRRIKWGEISEFQRFLTLIRFEMTTIFFVISTIEMRRDLKASEISHPNRVRNDKRFLTLIGFEMTGYVCHPDEWNEERSEQLIRFLSSFEMTGIFSLLRNDNDFFCVISTNGMRKDLNNS